MKMKTRPDSCRWLYSFSLSGVRGVGVLVGEQGNKGTLGYPRSIDLDGCATNGTFGHMGHSENKEYQRNAWSMSV